jgi:hypothetical protein
VSNGIVSIVDEDETSDDEAFSMAEEMDDIEDEELSASEDFSVAVGVLSSLQDSKEKKTEVNKKKDK